jgi:hypothetical protein
MNFKISLVTISLTLIVLLSLFEQAKQPPFTALEFSFEAIPFMVIVSSGEYSEELERLYK